MNKIKSFFNLPNTTILCIGFIMVFVSSNINWGKDHWKGILEADAKGYYAYLPAAFIYHDLNFGFFEEIEQKKYHNPNLYYDYRYEFNGKMVNKYYGGTALAQTPFFLIAHWYSAWSIHDQDGYSKPYPIMLNIASIFYCLLGLLYLSKVLTLYQVKDRYQVMVLLALALGTNLFYYSVNELGLSHVYSFAFISLFIYHGLKYFQTPDNKKLILLFLLLGIIVLIRPINGIIVAILPFISGDFGKLKQGIAYAFSKYPILLLGILLSLGIVSFQLIWYKLSTGNYFVYSYGEEKMQFLSPHFWDILFSYKKGLFLYTPMYLVSMLGGLYFWNRSKYAFWTWLGFFILLTYILSSWHMWYYGGSFSSRVFVEYLPYFGISLGLLFRSLQNRVLRKVLSGAIVVLVLFCQIQIYQYRYYQIHWEEMTKEKYWDVFLRIDKLL